MKLQELSIRKFLLLEIIGVTLTVALSLLTLYLLTGNSSCILWGFSNSYSFCMGSVLLEIFSEEAVRVYK